MHDENGAVLRSNNDWADTQANGIIVTGIPPMDPRESAVVSTLAPGHYTAVAQGANGTTGVVLVEACDLP